MSQLNFVSFLKFVSLFSNPENETKMSGDSFRDLSVEIDKTSHESVIRWLAESFAPTNACAPIGRNKANLAAVWAKLSAGSVKEIYSDYSNENLFFRWQDDSNCFFQKAAKTNFPFPFLVEFVKNLWNILLK